MKKFIAFLGLFMGLESAEIIDNCDSLSKLSDIVGSQSEIIPGWTNDGLDAGPWRLPKWDYVWEVCGKDEAWYGWKLNSGVGSINTTFTAYGSAELSFGNCWASGTVKVYLDEIEIASADPVKHKTVTFDFQAGAVLSIRDEGANSIIQISKFKILTCSEHKLIGFENCVDNWCLQQGTDDQYTKCDYAYVDVCFDPQIRYGSTVGGRPVVDDFYKFGHDGCQDPTLTSEDLLPWCKSLFPGTIFVTFLTYDTKYDPDFMTNKLGPGEGFVMTNGDGVWYDVKAGDWKDSDAVQAGIGDLSDCQKMIQSVKCQWDDGFGNGSPDGRKLI